MNIKKILQKKTGYLKKHNIRSFHQDAEILLCFVLNKEREFLLNYSDTKVSLFNFFKYSILIKKRVRGYSVAMLVGKKSFYGHDFFVNKNCLIPRPETELIVKEAKNIIVNNKNNFTIIDVGTGSACIIITILKEIVKFRISDIHFRYFAIDISKKALEVARQNLAFHSQEKRISLLHGDLLSPILENTSIFDSQKNSLLITANLPYLTKRQIDSSPSIKKEPDLALDGGANGLEYYDLLFKQIKKLARVYSSPIYILCEIDPSQKKKIINLQKKYLKEFNIIVKKDLASKYRLIIISKINN